MSTKTKAPAKAKSAAKAPTAKKAAKSAEPVVTTPAAADVPAAAPAEKPKGEKPAPAPKDVRNEVTRPKAGSICAGIWDVCDSMRAVGEKITFAAVKEKLPKINDSTIRTQMQRNRTYHG